MESCEVQAESLQAPMIMARHMRNGTPSSGPQAIGTQMRHIEGQACAETKELWWKGQRFPFLIKDNRHCLSSTAI